MDQDYVDGVMDIAKNITSNTNRLDRFFSIVIDMTMKRFGCSAEEAFEFFAEVYSVAFGDALRNQEDCE